MILRLTKGKGLRPISACTAIDKDGNPMCGCPDCKEKFKEKK